MNTSVKKSIKLKYTKSEALPKPASTTDDANLEIFSDDSNKKASPDLTPHIPNTEQEKDSQKFNPISRRVTNLREFDSEYFRKDLSSKDELLDLNDPKQRFMNAHHTEFDIKTFAEFFGYHVIYYFFLGPFIVLLAPIIGLPVIKNQMFWGWSMTFFQQAVQWLCIITSIAIYNSTGHGVVDYIEVYMIFASVLIRITFISSKYAHASKAFIRIFKTSFLTGEELSNELIVGPWLTRMDDIIEEQLQASVLRLDIDMSLFFFNFIATVDSETQARLSARSGMLFRPRKDINDYDEGNKVENLESEEVVKMSNDFKNERDRRDDEDNSANTDNTEKRIGSRNGEQNNTPLIARVAMKMMAINSLQKPRIQPDELIMCAPTQQSSNVSNTIKKPILRATELIRQTFRRYVRKSSKYQNTKYYGYSLAFDLITKSKVEGIRAIHIVIASAILRSFLPPIYRCYIHQNPFGDILVQVYLVVSTMLLNFVFFGVNLFLVAMNISDLKKRLYLMVQLSNLLSPKRDFNFDIKKCYPTLNIFDPISLKTWMNLRRLLSDFGDKFYLRNSFNIAIYLAFYSIILLILILQTLGLTHIYSDPLLLIVFGYESFVVAVVFLRMLTLGASINDQFRVHKSILKKNKTIISDLQKLQDAYFGENPIQPDNFIYQEGVKLLKAEIPRENFQAILHARLDSLLAILDEEIEELGFEETNNPYQILGFKIDYHLVKTLGVGLLSVALAVAQTYLNRGLNK